jgi:hypothetical protein
MKTKKVVSGSKEALNPRNEEGNSGREKVEKNQSA